MNNETPAAPAASGEDDLLNIKELAQRLGLKRSAVETMVAKRKIPIIRINRRVLRFRWRDVNAALDRMTVADLNSPPAFVLDTETKQVITVFMRSLAQFLTTYGRSAK